MNDSPQPIKHPVLEVREEVRHSGLRGLVSVYLHTRLSNSNEGDGQNPMNIYGDVSCGTATVSQNGFDVSINIKQALLSFNTDSCQILMQSVPEVYFQKGEYSQSLQGSENKQVTNDISGKVLLDINGKIDQTFQVNTTASGGISANVAQTTHRETLEKSESKKTINIFKISKRANYIAIGDENAGNPLNTRGFLEGTYKPHDESDFELPLFKVNVDTESNQRFLSVAVFVKKKHLSIDIESGSPPFFSIFNKKPSHTNVIENIKGTSAKTVEEYARKLRDRMISDAAIDFLAPIDCEGVYDLFQISPDSIVVSLTKYELRGVKYEK